MPRSHLKRAVVGAIHAPLSGRPSFFASVPWIFQDSVQRSPGEIQAGVLLFSVAVHMSTQSRDDAEGLCIPLEAIIVSGPSLCGITTRSHGSLVYSSANYLLTMVAEGWVPEIVGESGRLDDIGIQATPAADHAGW